MPAQPLAQAKADGPASRLRRGTEQGYFSLLAPTSPQVRLSLSARSSGACPQESKDRREGGTAPLEKRRLVASFKEEGVSFLSEVPQVRKSRFPRLICCLGLRDLPPQVQRQTRRADLRTCCKSQRNCVSFFLKFNKSASPAPLFSTSPQVPLPFSKLPKPPPHI